MVHMVIVVALVAQLQDINKLKRNASVFLFYMDFML
jgi:hypothetical protein